MHIQKLIVKSNCKKISNIQITRKKLKTKTIPSYRGIIKPNLYTQTEEQIYREEKVTVCGIQNHFKKKKTDKHYNII